MRGHRDQRSISALLRAATRILSHLTRSKEGENGSAADLSSKFAQLVFSAQVSRIRQLSSSFAIQSRYDFLSTLCRGRLAQWTGLVRATDRRDRKNRKAWAA